MANALLDALRPQPTGGLIVTFREEVDEEAQVGLLSERVGTGARSLSAVTDDILEAGDALPAFVLEDTGIAIIPGAADRSERVRESLLAEESVLEVRPEFWLFALQPFGDDVDRTWGVAATGADRSSRTGDGVKLCVLDTGCDLGHPDFAGRSIVSKSFVPGESVEDGHGHGTHCAGTAAGPMRPGAPSVPRYGVAPEASLYVGKVLNNSGSGRERDILVGIDWAIREGCAVISMSLGRPVREGEGPSSDYERLGRKALREGSLIVAAAGNDSARRYGYIAPVSAPANSSSIVAVAAVDQALEVAEFSCGGINPDGGEVDVAGPGVGVFSSVPRPRNYAVFRGTSMACPHAAGVAALWGETDPKLRGRQLWDQLTSGARALDDAPRDVGAGLVQAP